jgi:TfoX/Sxy family transcriptional regulator of competence genes
MPYDEQLAARIRRALRRSDIAERKMFGGVTFLRNGRMCCGVVGQDLVVRILEEDMPSALRRAHVRPMDFTGRPLRGFVYVGPRATATDDALDHWIEKGLAFTEPSASAKSRRAR